MKIKPTAVYFLAFSALLFLVHECHDWAHFSAARFICGCWGTKGFDNWTFCPNCQITTAGQVPAWIAGPLVNYVLIILAWWLMKPTHSPAQKSIGFSLLFATIPFVRILAAASGGGDETAAVRQIFQQTGGNRHLPALFGLILVLLLTVPALIRAFLMLNGWKERLLFFPAFLILPIFFDRLIVAGAMNGLLKKGVLAAETLPGVPLLLLLWTILWILVLLSGYKNVLRLLKQTR